MTETHSNEGLQLRLLLLLVVLCATAAVARADITVQGELTHELELLPGSSHTGTITIRNIGDRPEEVKLYQADYRSESPATHHYDAPGTNPRSNAAWVSFGPSRFTVPPGETYTIPYVMQIPSDGTLSGTFWSVLMIEAIPPESPESAQADSEQPQIGILQLIRYAFKFVTHIGATGTVQPEVLGATLVLEESVPVLGIDVGNTGTRSLKIEIWAEIYDADGILVGRRDGSGSTLYPDSTKRYRIPLHELAKAEYTALVVIDAGDNHVFGASFPLRLE